MRVVAVGSGESGSGRSVIAANLGVALARRGARVVLVDLDLRSGDLHLRLGAPHAGPGVTSLLRHGAKAAATAAVPVGGIDGLQLVAGVEETVRAASLSDAEVARAIRALRAFDADFVVVDLPSGIAPAVLDLFLAGDEQLVVAEPAHRAARQTARFLHLARLRQSSRGSRGEGANTRTPRVYTSLDDLVRDMYELRSSGEGCESHYCPALVLNRTAAASGASRDRFLPVLFAEAGGSVEAKVVAEVPENRELAENSSACALLERIAPRSRAAAAIGELARRLMGESDAAADLPELAASLRDLPV